MSVLVCLALRKAYATCAAISLLLGLFNAMPVYPLDGGRALRAGLCLVLPLGRAEAVSNIAGLAVCAAGLAGAISARGRMGSGLRRLHSGLSFLRVCCATDTKKGLFLGLR